MGASRRRINKTADRSRQFSANRFHNARKTQTMSPGSFGVLIKDSLTKKRIGIPKIVIPLEHDVSEKKAALAVTWYGHASVLIEIEDKRILADPMWSERASPVSFTGPKRLHQPPVTLEDIKNIDVIIISHDHYDHLDMPTILRLAAQTTAVFLLPIGVGAHLRKWGVAENRIVELDWDQDYQLGDVRLVCTEAQHFSGRSLKRDTTLWSSWVIAGVHHKVFFGGDTGYTKAFQKLGKAYGPFDVSLLPIGAYDRNWAQIHLNPEEAVQAHQDIMGGLFVPIHWATFNLAFHPWPEPIERLLLAAHEHTIKVAVPLPGERVIIGSKSAQNTWWRGSADSA